MTIPELAQLIFQKVLPTVGDVCLFGISVYTFRLTVFPKKLRFIGRRYLRSTFEGDSIEVLLENRSLSPTVVQSVSLVLDGYMVSLFSEGDNDYEPHVIDGFKTGVIRMEPYSCIYAENRAFDPYRFKNCKNCYLIVKTPRGLQYLSFAHGPRHPFLGLYHRRHPPQHTTINRDCFNDKIRKPYVRYALLYKDTAQTLHTVFILANGFMSETLFGYNSLSPEVVVNKETLCANLEAEFAKHHLCFGVEEFPPEVDNMAAEVV